jgi:hypothetical protein
MHVSFCTQNKKESNLREQCWWYADTDPWKRLTRGRETCVLIWNTDQLSGYFSLSPIIFVSRTHQLHQHDPRGVWMHVSKDIPRDSLLCLSVLIFTQQDEQEEGVRHETINHEAWSRFCSWSENQQQLLPCNNNKKRKMRVHDRQQSANSNLQSWIMIQMNFRCELFIYRVYVCCFDEDRSEMGWDTKRSRISVIGVRKGLSGDHRDRVTGAKIAAASLRLMVLLLMALWEKRGSQFGYHFLCPSLDDAPASPFSMLCEAWKHSSHVSESDAWDIHL